MSTAWPTLAELSGVAPDAVAVDDTRRALEWRELDRRSIACGRGLEALGATAGAHVAICVSNRSEFVEAVLGAWRAGCAYTPVKTGWTAGEVAAVLEDAGSRVLVTDRAAAADAARDCGVAVVDLDDGYETWLDAQSDEPFGDDRCGYKLPYTSGTTGRPKGVVMVGSGTTRFAAGWRAIATWAEALLLPGEGTHLFVSRLFNGAPQTFGFGALARGATLRILPRWDPVAALRALGDEDVTSTIMVPTMLRELLAIPGVDRNVSPAPSLRTLVHGGEPCPVSLKSAIADWFGDVLVEYYGFTEGGMTVVRPDEWRGRPGTVGRPLPGMTVRVLGDDGTDLGAHREGLVYFEPASGRRFSYQGDRHKTEQAHRGDAFSVGDIGWLDDDGFLYLCGRSADVVVCGGVNVYPAEVEAALCDVEGVADLCVVGGPDPVRGERLVAYVALLPGYDPKAVADALRHRAKHRLAPYKQPQVIETVADIPRDQTGKLLRRVLRDRLWQGAEQFAAVAPANPPG